jgi:HK97 family phage prohead protease
VLEQMRSGAIDGLSIGFKTIKARADGGIRHIHEAISREISVVTFPMLPSARDKEPGAQNSKDTAVRTV